MYYDKLMDIVNSKDGILNNIDIGFIQKFDRCIKDETTERERLKLNPIKISNLMNVPQKQVMAFFVVAVKMGIFSPRAFYYCSCCNEHFEIYSFKNIKCINECDIDESKNRDNIYIYYQLLYEIEECSFGNYGDYQMDYISEEDLGNFRGTLKEYDLIVGREEANSLLCKNKRDLEYTKIRIAHISDLHFGSSHNTGIDNKAGLSSISDISPKLFDNFKKAITSKKVDYIIISGDLTTQNEESGFEEFHKSMENISIHDSKIYIVPGNHECDRTKASEKLQFAYFTAYTNKYITPFNKECYILDKENKIFIYGFNSVNYKKDGEKELFYIKDADFGKLEQVCKDINGEVNDFESYCKIAVLHNNLLPHPSIEVKEYAEMLNLYAIKYKLVRLGFSIICSGHKHEEIIEKHIIYDDEDKERSVVLLSAPSLCGDVYNTRNGFQLINLCMYDDAQLVKLEIEKYELNTLKEYKKLKSLEIKFND